jgi:hypothetical protein
MSVYICILRTPLAALSKAWVCSCSFAGVVVDLSSGMDVCLLWVICVVR